MHIVRALRTFFKTAQDGQCKCVTIMHVSNRNLTVYLYRCKYRYKDTHTHTEVKAYRGKKTEPGVRRPEF